LSAQFRLIICGQLPAHIVLALPYRLISQKRFFRD